MPDEERGRDAQFGDLVQLILAHHLAVLDAVAGVLAGKVALGFAEGVDDVVDCGVAVPVDGDLVAGPVQPLHHGREVLPAAGGVAAPLGIAVEGRVVRLGEVAGEALVGAVLDDLDAPQLQTIVAEAGDEAAGLRR